MNTSLLAVKNTALTTISNDDSFQTRLLATTEKLTKLEQQWTEDKIPPFLENAKAFVKFKKVVDSNPNQCNSAIKPATMTYENWKNKNPTIRHRIPFAAEYLKKQGIIKENRSTMKTDRTHITSCIKVSTIIAMGLVIVGAKYYTLFS